MFFKTFLTLIVVLCFAENVFGKDPNITEISLKCAEENNVQEDELKSVNLTAVLKTDKQNLKCLIKCMMVEFNIMNENGDLLLDVATDNNAKLKKFVPACRNVTGTDACDKSLNFHNCVWSHVKNIQNTDFQ